MIFRIREYIIAANYSIRGKDEEIDNNHRYFGGIGYERDCFSCGQRSSDYEFCPICFDSNDFIKTYVSTDWESI